MKNLSKLQQLHDEFLNSPEGIEYTKKEKERDELEKEWDSKILEEHNYIRRPREFFLHILPKEMFTMNPDLEWLSQEEMFNDAVFEACNWDETTAHSHMALKFVLYRIIVPKDKWNEKFDRDTFKEYSKNFFNNYYLNH